MINIHFLILEIQKPTIQNCNILLNLKFPNVSFYKKYNSVVIMYS